MVKISHLRSYDAADFLQTPEDRASYLTAVLQDGDPVIVRKGLETVARSLAREATDESQTIVWEGLDRLRQEDGPLLFATLIDVARMLGFRLSATASEPTAS